MHTSVVCMHVVCVSVCVCGVNVVSELYTTLVYHRLRQISDMGGDIK